MIQKKTTSPAQTSIPINSTNNNHRAANSKKAKRVGVQKSASHRGLTQHLAWDLRQETSQECVGGALGIRQPRAVVLLPVLVEQAPCLQRPVQSRRSLGRAMVATGSQLSRVGSASRLRV